jgi:hypothetical protein
LVGWCAVSADGSVTLAFADGEYRFAFRIGQLRELQESVNKWRVAIGAPIIGPMSLLKQIETQDAWPHDVREVLRIGLIGGNSKLTPIQVTGLLKLYFDDRPPLENYPVAHMALAAGFIGVEWDRVGKGEAEETTTEATTASSSPRSTEPQPSSDGIQETPITSASGNLPPASTPITEPTAAMTNPSP